MDAQEYIKRALSAIAILYPFTEEIETSETIAERRDAFLAACGFYGITSTTPDDTTKGVICLDQDIDPNDTFDDIGFNDPMFLKVPENFTMTL